MRVGPRSRFKGRETTLALTIGGRVNAMPADVPVEQSSLLYYQVHLAFIGKDTTGLAVRRTDESGLTRLPEDDGQGYAASLAN